MRQVLQSVKSGEIHIEDIPTPSISRGCILVKNLASLISVGTERAKLEINKKNILEKAIARPDLVKQVLLKIRQEGVVSVYNKVIHRLDSLSPLGYSSSGEVIAIGENVSGFNIGDKVSCAGAGFANHAEIVCVPVNLAALIPSGVSMQEACFTTLGSIALQGIRQAEVSVGENICVIGLGLLGQLSVQILAASGCNVFGIDIEAEKIEFSERMGAKKSILRNEDIETFSRNVTGGFGFDAVIITAATTDNDPVALAGLISRDRGKVVVVGDTKIDIPRKDYYEKELKIILSRSYGPGRYDQVYEEKGIDYPIGYVRWTEKRNMEEFLNLLSMGKVKVDKLITHKFKLKDAQAAYSLISEKKSGFCLGVIFEYDDLLKSGPLKIPLGLKSSKQNELVKIGFIGSGNFASGVLLPCLKKISGVELRGICSASGLSAKNVAKRYNFQYTASSYQELLDDQEINTVFVVTTHNFHSDLAVKSLKAGKATFVEKPLSITKSGLEQVMEAAKNNPRLMVGFNRRFSTHTQFVKKFLSQRSGSCVFSYRVNVGVLSSGSWIYDEEIGGGRILSEICHFIDFILFLLEAKPKEVFAYSLSGKDPDTKFNDNLAINLKFSDGSVGTIIYTSKGDIGSGKEYFEIFADGASLVINDFKESRISRKGRIKRLKTISQDKGHMRELKSFIYSVNSGSPMPISLEDIYYSTLTTLNVRDSLKSNLPQNIV